MGKKTTTSVNPDDTIVFQDDEIESYDELSLTRAMRDASKSVKERLARERGESEQSEPPEPTLDDLDFDTLKPED